MKVYALSDLHIDHADNREWLERLPDAALRGDVLLLAGDVSDSLPRLRWAFTELTRRFLKVLYVPGNHELWLLRDDAADSFAKFDQVAALAAECGVSMAPFHCGPLSIVPLLSWYDFSFGEPTPELLAAWTDFRACRWPPGVGPAQVASRFHAMNAPYLQTRNRHVLSFSHFLPRPDLLPTPLGPIRALLLPVLGSSALEQQLRQLRPQLHVFGHSHARLRCVHDGITYLNQAIGYPQERGGTPPALTSIFELCL
ncbi:MAG TPA: metallophosphoesterase [Duganella sp.]|nr:metallophosphoesterase [Duganella sp.]